MRTRSSVFSQFAIRVFECMHKSDNLHIVLFCFFFQILKIIWFYTVCTIICIWKLFSYFIHWTMSDSRTRKITGYNTNPVVILSLLKWAQRMNSQLEKSWIFLLSMTWASVFILYQSRKFRAFDMLYHSWCYQSQQSDQTLLK